MARTIALTVTLLFLAVSPRVGSASQPQPPAATRTQPTFLVAFKDIEGQLKVALAPLEARAEDGLLKPVTTFSFVGIRPDVAVVNNSRCGAISIFTACRVALGAEPVAKATGYALIRTEVVPGLDNGVLKLLQCRTEISDMRVDTSGVVTEIAREIGDGLKSGLNAQVNSMVNDQIKSILDDNLHSALGSDQELPPFTGISVLDDRLVLVVGKAQSGPAGCATNAKALRPDGVTAKFTTADNRPDNAVLVVTLFYDHLHYYEMTSGLKNPINNGHPDLDKWRAEDQANPGTHRITLYLASGYDNKDIALGFPSTDGSPIGFPPDHARVVLVRPGPAYNGERLFVTQHPRTRPEERWGIAEYLEVRDHCLTLPRYSGKAGTLDNELSSLQVVK